MKLFSPQAALARGLFVAASLALAASPARALSPGDVAIVGRINNGTPDTFTVAVLTDLPAGTTIYFTDNGWTGTQFRGVSATDGDGNEQLTRLVVNATVPAGTLLTAYTNTPSYTWTSNGTAIPGVSGGSLSDLLLATAGDQIYAFEGGASNPALTVSQHLFVFDDTNGFENATSANSGAIPPGLALGTSAVTINAAVSGGRAINPSFLSATSNDRAAWLAVFTNPANWVTTTTLPTGTFVVSGGGGGTDVTVSIAAFDADASEAGLDPATFRLARTGSTTSPLVVNYSVGGTASNGIDYTPSLTGSATIPADQSTLDVTLTPVDDAAAEGTESVTLTVTSGSGYVVGSDSSATANLADNDSVGPVLRRISEIQGAGLASPLVGQVVRLQGVVVASFQSTTNGLSGFFVQEEDTDADAEAATSEGIFVFDNGTGPAVTPGTVVSVTGTVTEFFGLTEIASVSDITIAGTAPLPTAATLTLPFASIDQLERYEGMRVSLPQTLTVTNTFDLFRFGEIEVSSGGRLPEPTNVAAPGAPAAAIRAANALNRLIIDDGNSRTFPGPTPFLFTTGTSAEATLRTGDTVAQAVGVLSYSFNRYRLVPAAPLSFVRANPRPAAPDVGRSLRIIGANVLNYFNGNGAGGGFPTSRGADSLAEFERQRAHIVASIVQANPDIIGLTELENDGFGATSAIQSLVTAVNAAAPAGTTYAFINPGISPIGTDEITCGFLYKVGSVQPVGTTAVNLDPVFSRPPIAQTWRASNGERFTVTVNHFKSKGSAPSSGPNADQGDGQSAWNVLRTQQAQALTAWLATNPTGIADPDILIIGDLNAYAKEDPITALLNAGYVNLIERFEGEGGYSYSFGGQFGHLDHAIGSRSFYTQTTDADTWHSNADEPTAIDYNLENKDPAQQAINAGSTPWRAADHDPVVVGFRPGRPLRPLP